MAGPEAEDVVTEHEIAAVTIAATGRLLALAYTQRKRAHILGNVEG